MVRTSLGMVSLWEVFNEGSLMSVKPYEGWWLVAGARAGGGAGPGP